jgi:hypothetical protein
MSQLGEKMWALLGAIETLEGRHGEYRVFPPNVIAITMGLDGPERRGRFVNGKGNWTGHMAPAQRIISTLRSLEARGLVYFAAREDGYSGSAYGLTDAAREALTERREEMNAEE